jgi:hypothetical protein
MEASGLLYTNIRDVLVCMSTRLSAILLQILRCSLSLSRQMVGQRTETSYDYLLPNTLYWRPHPNLHNVMWHMDLKRHRKFPMIERTNVLLHCLRAEYSAQSHLSYATNYQYTSSMYSSKSLNSMEYCANIKYHWLKSSSASTREIIFFCLTNEQEKICAPFTYVRSLHTSNSHCTLLYFYTVRHVLLRCVLRTRSYVPILQVCQSQTKFPGIRTCVISANPFHIPTRMFEADILTKGVINWTKYCRRKCPPHAQIVRRYVERLL